MLYNLPEQHRANRSARPRPIGGVLHISPGMYSGHSEKEFLLEYDMSKVGLPAHFDGMAADPTVKTRNESMACQSATQENIKYR